MADHFIDIINGQQTQKSPTVVSSGSASAGNVVGLNAAGQLDPTVLPTGVGVPTASIVASEALSAGAFVNIWNNAGTQNVRNADCSTTGKAAQGYVLSAAASGASATVYFSGLNTSVTGQTIGQVFLGTAGAASASAPTGTGKVVQDIGVAINATSIEFAPKVSTVLA